ncbi:MAG: hypothetical protein GX621_15375, partial [Pirellulaceae bacterium]|nr:hypothetical protein [Pirellulaceae bacterium]
MNALIIYSARVVANVLESSWQAAVLAVVVVLLGLLLRERLSARWRCALWLVVVARLLMPVAPESRLSLFNLLPVDLAAASDESPGEPAAPVAAAPMPAFDPYAPGGLSPFLRQDGQFAESVDPSAAKMERSPSADEPAAWLTAQNVWLAVAAAWLAGVVLLAARMAVLSSRLRRLLRGCR